MSIAKRSIESSAYNVGANIVQTAILALRSIFLARLLSPDDFGNYAFAASIVIITSSLPNFGMGPAFVHRAKESSGEDALRVYFSLSFIFNLVWGTIIAIVGYLLLDADNLWVLWSILIAKMIQNLTNVGRAKLVKRIVFRRIALVDTVVAVATTVSALWLAKKGFGVWSLVSTDIVAALIMVIGFYVYRPIWLPRFDWAPGIVRYFLDFGKRTFVAGFLGQTLDHLDDLWTGWFLGEASLGFYSRAYTFATYPRKILAAPLTAVAGGTYAELKDQPDHLSKAFFRVNAFLVRSGFFFGGIMALIAPEFIHLIIGDKWLPMLTAFRLMLVYTLLDPIRGTIASLFTALGYPEKVVKVRLIQMVFLVVGLFAFGFRWGINGVAIAVNIMLIAGIVLLLWRARDHVDFSIKNLFLIPIVALIIAMGITYLIFVPMVSTSSLLLFAIAKITLFIVIYVLVILIFERKQITDFVNLIKGIS